jgi:hypothetical protein
MKSLPKGSYGLAVDLPGALWGKVSSSSALERAVKDLRQKGYFVDMILGDSTSYDVIRKIHDRNSFDAALIDGDHTYSGVKQDWINYGDCAPIVAFHDIVGDGQIEKVKGHLVEVPKLWAELKVSIPKTVEFVDSGSKMGIGVCDLR